MKRPLPWHHVHVTIEDREAAAAWHARHTPARRGQPTKRSENLLCGPNLMQIQSTKVGRIPQGARLDGVGIGVTSLERTLAEWQSGGGTVVAPARRSALVADPWGVRFELVDAAQAGFTHINIVAKEPASLASWYQTRLGGSSETCSWDPSREAVRYDTMQLVFSQMEADSAPIEEMPIDHLGWYTQDLDSIYQALSAANVAFPVPPRQFGSARLAFGEDPSGIWFELVEPPGGKIVKAS